MVVCSKRPALTPQFIKNLQNLKLYKNQRVKDKPLSTEKVKAKVKKI